MDLIEAVKDCEVEDLKVLIEQIKWELNYFTKKLSETHLKLEALTRLLAEKSK